MNELPLGLMALIGTTEIVVVLLVLTVTVATMATVIGLLLWAVSRLGRAPGPAQPPQPPGGSPTSQTPAAPPPPPPQAPSASPSPTSPPSLPRCPRCGTPQSAATPHGVCPGCALAAGFATQPMPGASRDAGRIQAEGPAPADLAPHFPQLEIVSQIGHGGMGWVYQARQPSLDRKVALKILPPETARDPSFEERFRREARALARLSHPNIVGIYDFGQAGPYFYLVMEFVDGANLRERQRARRLSPEEAFAIVPGICAALQYAHEEGVVHRDVKPENILIDTRGRVKIADFGIAKIARGGTDITLTGPQAAMGTPHYMAPEQLESPGTVDHRADIYALGVVFYEMLTGGLPLGRFDPPSRNLAMDERMDDVVLRSLERDPDRRYQTAAAVKSDVERIVSEPRPSLGP